MENTHSDICPSVDPVTFRLHALLNLLDACLESRHVRLLTLSEGQLRQTRIGREPPNARTFVDIQLLVQFRLQPLAMNFNHTREQLVFEAAPQLAQLVKSATQIAQRARIIDLNLLLAAVATFSQSVLRDFLNNALNIHVDASLADALLAGHFDYSLVHTINSHRGPKLLHLHFNDRYSHLAMVITHLQNKHKLY